VLRRLPGRIDAAADHGIVDHNLTRTSHIRVRLFATRWDGAGE
jgi:hypothetical protein